MDLIDSHLHFDVFDEDGEVAGLMERAEAAGVRRMVAIGGTDQANHRAVALASVYPGRIYAVVGYDRMVARTTWQPDAVKSLTGRPGVVGIGETGLDYHYEADTGPAQQALFAAMSDVAAGCRLPLVIHSRDAEDDTLRLLERHRCRWTGAPDRLGVLHCFTGGARFAEQLLELGLYLSFSGIVTFATAESLRRVAETVPEERLLVETDAPYLAPPPHRGQRNEPAYVVHVARVLAEIRGCSLEALASATTRNAERLFGLNGGAAAAS